MIAANELRIGNWIDAEIGTIKKPKKVNTIINGVYTSTPPPSVESYIISYSRSIRLSNLFPIPITPEILEKCGFLQHHDDCYNHVMYIKKVFDGGKLLWGVYPNEIGGGVVIRKAKPLESLHQLQNLYFALTGEELTYKP